MIAPCTVVPASGQFVPGVIGFLDCQAQTLGAQGYQALAAPGSTVSLLLTTMLTLFVAFIGYRMLFGQTPTIREGVLSFVRIGIVLALATSWPAYQRVIYDVVLHEPAELVAEVGGADGLPGSGGGLVGRLDNADRSFQALAIYGVGQPRPDAAGQITTPVAPPMFIGFDTFALGAARALFLAGAIGAFALLRIAGGFLLAFGPLFILFLLFEGTRGLFEGWVRALIGIALGALATSIVLGIELALIEPWLADLLARRMADLAIIGAPAQLLAIAAIFAGVLGVMLFVMGRIAFSWKLPISWPELPGMARGYVRDSRRAFPSSADRTPIADRSRAALIADAVATIQRREQGGASGGGGAPARITSQAARARDGAPALASPPLGHSFPRRTATRVSASAGPAGSPIMTKKNEALDAYYAEAGSWAQDRQDELRASRRVAWIVAVIAAGIALFEAIALLLLMPLKTVVPYTLLVDRQTGYVQALKPVDAQLVSSTKALTQSFLVQYVITREGYDVDALQANYRKVGLWSAGDARRAYVAQMQASNPDSPLVRYPRSTIVDVEVKGVTPLNKNVAMVRFATQRRDAGGRDAPPENWVSVIRYTYSGEPMSIADRYVNPLGFQVVRYNRSAETLPQPAPETPTPAAAVAGP